MDNLEIIPFALSDSPREGYLMSGHSNELNRLGDSGEKVQITSLDHEDGVRAWSPDFIKIDAEYEEPRVVEGGRTFFSQRSPLVMYEIADKPAVPALVAAFAALGYRSYRCLPSVPLLVPYGAGDPISYEVNLFAAKPDRAAALAKEGFLVETAPSWQPDETTRAGGLALLRTQQFSAAWVSLHLNPINPVYRDALAAYGAWLTSQNYGALLFALTALTELCERDANLARQATLARVAHDAGARNVSVATLQALLARLRHDQTVTEPFWPASRSFDKTAPTQDTLADWFVASALEQLELTWCDSSFYGCVTNLEWLSKQPWCTIEMQRRLVLKELRAGRDVEIPETLLQSASDHINAEVWRSGFVRKLGPASVRDRLSAPPSE